MAGLNGGGIKRVMGNLHSRGLSLRIAGLRGGGLNLAMGSLRSGTLGLATGRLGSSHGIVRGLGGGLGRVRLRLGVADDMERSTGRDLVPNDGNRTLQGAPFSLLKLSHLLRVPWT